MTTVADGLFQYGGAAVMSGPLPFFGKQGKTFFVDPVNGADGNSGQSLQSPLATLYAAHALMTSGNNDVCYLVGNGGASGTARLSTANAVSAAARIPSAAVPTTGTLTWSKSACHLIGITAPSVNSRARIAPPTGTYTQATFGSGNFIVVSGQGCYFSNFSVFNGFSTGGVNQIAWTDSGGRNCYDNVDLFGMGDAASAADTGSHTLLITGTTGENQFRGCQIGSDFSVARSSGVSEMSFAGGTPRNKFIACDISTWAGAAGCFWADFGASAIDRYVMFRNCVFTNPTLGGPGATAMTVGFSVNAAPGGVILLPNCLSQGATKMTTTGLAFTNQAAGAAGGGLGVAIT